MTNPYVRGMVVRREVLGDEHVDGAIEIKEVLLHTAIYCGVPAANGAFAVAQRVLDETEQESST